ncbi:hypothetical protein TUBRATIS_30860 [Tubulinosema ratisbonensis]|uniref:Uncharacterized protein n=1 Tax=Tubulinosema ratisbonensis TaxID=291195 RepID=A0A437AH88_9MICR|nr:hypothetical protein TUBRATIS_30860 [Tubulinosema ratisbonensis]
MFLIYIFKLVNLAYVKNDQISFYRYIYNDFGTDLSIWDKSKNKFYLFTKFILLKKTRLPELTIPNFLEVLFLEICDQAKMICKTDLLKEPFNLKMVKELRINCILLLNGYLEMKRDKNYVKEVKFLEDFFEKFKMLFDKKNDKMIEEYIVNYLKQAVSLLKKDRSQEYYADILFIPHEEVIQ